MRRAVRSRTRPVIFKVTQNDGVDQRPAGSRRRRSSATTDSQGTRAGAVDARRPRRRRRQRRRGLRRRLRRHRHLHRDRHAGRRAARSSSIPATIRSAPSASRCRSRSSPSSSTTGTTGSAACRSPSRVREGGGSFARRQPTRHASIVSDSDGRVAATLTLGLQEGNANNLVEATFAANAGVPGGVHRVGTCAGQSREHRDLRRRARQQQRPDSRRHGPRGADQRAALEPGRRAGRDGGRRPTRRASSRSRRRRSALVKLLVDGTTAQLPGEYPSLEYDIVTVPGQNNTVGPADLPAAAQHRHEHSCASRQRPAAAR